MPYCRHLLRGLFAISAVGAVLITPSFGLTKDELAIAQARYLQEQADCKRRGSSDEITTCMLEARNSFAEIRQGRMGEPIFPSALARNALLRCDVHHGDDKTACEARIRGQGRIDGSVSGGGIYRELEIKIPNQ